MTYPTTKKSIFFPATTKVYQCLNEGKLNKRISNIQESKQMRIEVRISDLKILSNMSITCRIFFFKCKKKYLENASVFKEIKKVIIKKP